MEPQHQSDAVIYKTLLFPYSVCAYTIGTGQHYYIIACTIQCMGVQSLITLWYHTYSQHYMIVPRPVFVACWCNLYPASEVVFIFEEIIA